MPTENPRATVRVDRDGVKITATPRVRRSVWVIAALAVLAMVVLVGRRAERAPAPPPEASVRPPRAAGGAAGRDTSAAVPPANAPLTRVERPQAGPRGRDLPPRSGGGQAVAAPEPGADGEAAPAPEASGIALFPPMGTDPIKRGIIVPDDFELPPGYVRHRQVTDDGQPLPPILMFHPDFQPVDEHGEPVSIPPDRVVPPDMAPPGLAIQILEVPESDAPADAPEPDR